MPGLHRRQGWTPTPHSTSRTFPTFPRQVQHGNVPGSPATTEDIQSTRAIPTPNPLPFPLVADNKTPSPSSPSPAKKCPRRPHLAPEPRPTRKASQQATLQMSALRMQRSSPHQSLHNFSTPGPSHEYPGAPRQRQDLCQMFKYQNDKGPDTSVWRQLPIPK